jgi:hypothetical protein
MLKGQCPCKEVLMNATQAKMMVIVENNQKVFSNIINKNGFITNQTHYIL